MFNSPYIAVHWMSSVLDSSALREIELVSKGLLLWSSHLFIKKSSGVCYIKFKRSLVSFFFFFRSLVSTECVFSLKDAPWWSPCSIAHICHIQPRLLVSDSIRQNRQHVTSYFGDYIIKDRKFLTYYEDIQGTYGETNKAKIMKSVVCSQRELKPIENHMREPGRSFTEARLIT